MTGEDLDPSQVVSDYKGYLYNKESVIRYLLDKRRASTESDSKGPYKQYANKFKHLKSINDVLDIKNFSSLRDLKNDTVTYLVPCGHLNSFKLVRELIGPDAVLNCPECNSRIESSDIIPLYDSGLNDFSEQNETRYTRLRELHLYHNLKPFKKTDTARKKKEKKRKINEVDDAENVKKLKRVHAAAHS